MSVNKEDVMGFLNDSAKKVRRVAVEGVDTVKEKYRQFKVGAELDDLYIELGKLINRAYNLPDTVSESEVAALNELINEKIAEKAKNN
jgi:hypothetical protein